MNIALTTYSTAIVFWLITEAWVGLRERGKVLKGKDMNSRNMVVIASVIATYIGVTLSHKTFFPILGNSTENFILGAIIIVVGISLRIWSVRTLGQFFRSTVMVQEKHLVISHGPYKYVRHPSYSGVLIAILGVGIGTGNWLSLLVMFLLIFIGLLYRIKIEEKVLSTELGETYRNYMRHTKKLIPFVY